MADSDRAPREISDDDSPANDGKRKKKKIFGAIIVIVVIIVAITAGAIYSWNHQDWGAYCSKNFPGSVFNSTSNECEISSTDPVSVPTVNSSGTGTLDDDKVFLIEAGQTADEMESASEIFLSTIDVFREATAKVDNAETNYEYAVGLLNEEQSLRNSTASDYASAMASTGRDVDLARDLTSYYRSLLDSQDSLIASYKQDVQKYDAARKAALQPIDFAGKGIDIGVLSDTSQKNIDKLSALPVSSDLQPMKDQYIAALTSYKKSGDAFTESIDYYNKGDITDCTKSITQSTSYIEAGKNQLQMATLKLKEYQNKIS